MPDAPTIALAGASGDFGERIAKELVARRHRPRPSAAGLNADEGRRIEATGAALVGADPADVMAMAEACAGATCVVSALNGLHEVMIDRQGILLAAAVEAGVPRFIFSDYLADMLGARPCAPARTASHSLRDAGNTF